MRTSIFYLGLLLIASCRSGDTNSGTSRCARKFQSGQSSAFNPEHYSRLKERISLRKGPKEGSQLYSTIVDSLCPYWYTTPWDFNGITQVPRQGNIACGYFVTTILRDAGLPVNRVKLAQAPSSKLIDAVCATNTIHHFTGLEALQTYLNGYPANTLFILGLDNHVGFVAKESGGVYFINATYVGDKAVIKEVLAEAAPVLASKTLMIGKVP